MSYILINGKRVNTPEGFQIEYSLDLDTRTVAVGVSSPIDLEGDLAKQLGSAFFTDCDSVNSVIKATYNPGCDRKYEFDITYQGIEYCLNSCETSVRLQKLQDRECFDYFDRTAFWQNGWFEDAQAGVFRVPKVRYAVQPPWTAMVSFSLNAELANTLILAPIILPTVSKLGTVIKGMLNYRTAPLIKQILEYHCNKCGLTFESSILQGDYANLVLFEGEVWAGYNYEKRENRDEYQKGASTNWTIVELLDNLKPVFNAEWRIFNGTLYFERKDYFDQIRTVELIDVTDDSCLDESACYQYRLDNEFAYGRFEYQKDSVEVEGNKAYLYGYKDIVEWNDPPEDWQSGEFTNIVNFAPVRFMRDRVAGGGNFPDAEANPGDNNGEEQQPDYWKEYLIDRFRSGRNHPYYSSLFGAIGPSGTSYDHHVIVSESQQQSLPKLILLEDNFDYDDALAIRRPVSTPLGDESGFLISQMQCYDYNYPMFFDENYEEPELYQRFHYIDDPRSQDRKTWVIDSIEFAPKDFCETLNLIDTQFHRLYVNTHYGKGIIEGGITVDDEKKTITVKDIRIRC